MNPEPMNMIDLRPAGHAHQSLETTPVNGKQHRYGEESKVAKSYDEGEAWLV